jgi:hypothetical protein
MSAGNSAGSRLGVYYVVAREDTESLGFVEVPVLL